jgi:hypothetical protein
MEDVAPATSFLISLRANVLCAGSASLSLSFRSSSFSLSCRSSSDYTALPTLVTYKLFFLRCLRILLAILASLSLDLFLLLVVLGNLCLNIVLLLRL